MKFKKMLCLGIAAVMSVTLLAGCGGGAAKTGGQQSESDANTAVTDNTGNEQDSSGNTPDEGNTDGAGGVKGANEDMPNTQTTDETLRIGLSAEPSTIWGSGVGKVENEAQIISSAIMDRLVNVDRNTGDVYSMLASEWEWVDDTHCTFTLRDDVTMSDGTPLVADDVVYSAGVWMDINANTDTGRFLAGAKADDEHTVTIEFNTAAPDFLNMIAWSNFGIVSEDEVNAAGGLEEAAKNPVIGVGRYKFKEWKSGQSITLERNDDYYDKDYAGYYKEIVFTFTQDSAARAMAVQSGDLNVAWDMPISMVNTYVGSDTVDVVMHTFGQNTRLFYNMGPKAGPTADLKVRQAIDKALDFEAIAMVGTAGTVPAVLGYFDLNSKYYNETFTAEERAVDVEGAKALLAEAGYADGLELSLVGMQDQNPIFTVIQENLRQVGINLTINIVDTPQFVEAANGGDYDLIHVGDLVDARYPAMMTFYRQSIIDTFCIGGPKYTTPEVDAAVGALIEEKDEKKAQDQAAELEKIWKDEMWFSNTYSEMKAAVTSKGLKGYNTIERGFIDPTGFYK
ncbi:MAG: ABC transporter substrate-binding protein [Eubacterium sp.]|nr:ABC transporter substrate-binding protein [Eubacterium sp.]